MDPRCPALPIVHVGKKVDDLSRWGEDGYVNDFRAVNVHLSRRWPHGRGLASRRPAAGGEQDVDRGANDSRALHLSLRVAIRETVAAPRGRCLGKMERLHVAP